MDAVEFERFLQEYEHDIFSFCRYLTMNNDKANDLYQETVLQAFEKRLANNHTAKFGQGPFPKDGTFQPFLAK